MSGQAEMRTAIGSKLGFERLPIDAEGVSRALRRPELWLITSALVIGAVSRFWALDFGLPYRYHIDEQGWIAYGGLLCSGHLDFPAWTAGPNLLHILMCGGDILLFLGGWVSGAWATPAAFRAAYDADPTAVYLTGRSVSALLGTLTPLLVYLLGAKLWNRKIGLGAMLLLSLTFLHVRDSHFVVSDILVAFLLAACLICCALAIKGKAPRWSVLGALFAGLATGTKFTLGLAFAPVALAFILSGGLAAGRSERRWPRAIKSLAALGLMFVLGFMLAYPNVFKALVDAPDLRADFLSEWRAAQTRAALWQVDPLPGWLFYLEALGRGMGWPLLGVSILGVAYSIWRRTPADLLLLSFLVPFYAFLGSQGYYTAHYMIPALPLLVLLAARFGWRALERFGTRPRLQLGLAAAALLVLLLPSVIAIARFNWLLQQQDTRTIAKRWIEANVPAGAVVGSSLYASWEPPLSTRENPQPQSSREYRVVSLGGLGGVSDLAFEELHGAGVEYLSISSFVYDIPLKDPARRRAREAFFEDLERHGRRIHVIRPYGVGPQPPFEYDQIYGPWSSLTSFDRPGPTIEIYQLARPTSSE